VHQKRKKYHCEISENEEELIDHVDYLTPLGKSDHAVLSWLLIVEPQESLPNKQQRFVCHKGDYGSPKLQLSHVNWSEKFDGKDVNPCWLLFKDIWQDRNTCH